MFNKSNFCHIASNNRNEQKGSVFIYKTQDPVATVTQNGYFNEKLIDINLHDLIIHIEIDQIGRTQNKNILIVTERTSDNVNTRPIVDQTVKNDLDDLGDQVSEIQALIPENASTENLLITANDLTAFGTNYVKKSATEMQTISGPVSITEEICLVDGADGAAKHSLSIIAGIPTETATEMDIVGDRKFDILPTTDETTPYADLNPQKMVTKGQVAAGIATAIAPLAVDSNVVHKTGEETISGVKKFNDTLLAQDDTIDSSVNPTAVLTRVIARTLDKNDNKIGSLYAQQDTDGTMRAILQCAKNDIVSELVAEILSDGTKQARAPATPANASGTEIAVASWVRNLLNQYATPTGAVIAYAGTTAPAGFLICDGSAVSRTTYSAMFAAIGTTYGAGDGNSTFNLPDFRGCFLRMSGGSASSIGTKQWSAAPNITGGLNVPSSSTDGNAIGVSGAFAGTGTKISIWWYNSAASGIQNTSFNAARSSGVYQNVSEVRPTNYATLFCIKY